MDFQIAWTDLAISDLQEIVSFIAKDNPTAAALVGEDVIRAVDVLATFPFIGPSYARRSDGGIREIVCRKRYRIFYRVSEGLKQVEVLRVWHTARDEPGNSIG